MKETDIDFLFFFVKKGIHAGEVVFSVAGEVVLNAATRWGYKLSFLLQADLFMSLCLSDCWVARFGV